MGGNRKPMITQEKKREIEFIVESLPAWLRGKLSILFADNILTGDWEEFDYMLFCIDIVSQKLENYGRIP